MSEIRGLFLLPRELYQMDGNKRTKKLLGFTNTGELSINDKFGLRRFAVFRLGRFIG